jgi:virginiamycin B lyase
VREIGTAGAVALVLLAQGLVGAGSATAVGPTDFALEAAPSRAAVTLYRMPRVLPTGGTGPLAADPFGNLWFNETYEEPVEPGERPHHPGEIVRMTRDGAITVVAQKKRGGDFAVAPDGSIWFSGFHGIGHLALDGSLTEFVLPDGDEGPNGLYRTTDEGPLVVAPNGDVWFTATRHLLDEEGREATSEPIIGRFTSGGELSEFDLPGGGGYPTRLAIGPDGNVWFTAAAALRVGFVTPAGLVEEFAPLPKYSFPGNIVAGPDGALWFAMEEEGPVIARITTSGELTKFPIGGEEEGIGAAVLASGPDGRIWFGAEEGTMGRISPSGRISRLPIPSKTWIEDIVVGPEGSLWYSSPAEPPCLPGDAVCGQGGYYESGIIGRVDPAPLALALRGGEPGKGGRQAKVKISCIDGMASSVCHGRLRLRLGREVVGTRTYKLGADLTRAFPVQLNEEARGRLLRAGHLKLKCVATLAGGRTETRPLRLRLVRASVGPAQAALGRTRGPA